MAFVLLYLVYIEEEEEVKPWSHDWPIAPRAYPSFCNMKWPGVFLLPLDGMLVHRRSLPHNLLGSPNKSPVPIYTPGWREAMWEWSVLPKNTTQCPRPGLESGLLVPGTSALTTSPPLLPVYIECAGYLYTNCDVKWQTRMFTSWQTCISRAVIKGRSL